MSDSDKVCKIINCEHYSDCVCAFCDCIEKAYNKGRADAEAEWKDLPNEYADRLAEQSYQRGRRDAIPEGMMLVTKDDFTEDLLNMGYTKGRADAIDEFASRLVEEGKKIKYLRHIWIEQTCKMIAEQMKGEADDQTE